MTKVTNVRNETANTSTGSKEKSIHWINLYRKGAERHPVNSIGGFSIDHCPDYVDACQKSENFAQNAFGSAIADAYYNQAGVSSKTAVTQDLSAFM